MGKLRGDLNYANVMSTIAVVVAVAGGTTAIAASVGKNSVSSKSIKSGNVTARDLAGIRVVKSERVGAFPEPARATCPGRERLIGGGALGFQNNPPGDPDTSVALTSSYPDGDSWVVVRNRNGAGSIEAYALCLIAKPGS